MTQAGSVYGEALYTLALEEGLTDALLAELNVLQESFHQEPDFIRLLSSPNLPKQERCQVLENSFRDKLHPYVLNFLKILTEKGYVRHFSDCVAAYTDHYNLDNGIMPVTAITAVALTQQQSEKLTEKLEKITGKTVKLSNKVDSACIGGVRLDYDGKRLDDTISHRMDAIRGLLTNTVL